jgi:hypothetical protein
MVVILLLVLFKPLAGVVEAAMEAPPVMVAVGAVVVV